MTLLINGIRLLAVSPMLYIKVIGMGYRIDFFAKIIDGNVKLVQIV